MSALGQKRTSTWHPFFIPRHACSHILKTNGIFRLSGGTGTRGARNACLTLKDRPIAPLEFLDLWPVRISAKLAAYFWIGRIARYCHLRALAPAHTGTRPLAEHRDRGVPRNRRTQHIDVGCRTHDGAAQRHPVRTPLELEGAGRAFPLGGFGLRTHADRGANHRCNRNYSCDCHVLSPLVGPASDGRTSKTGRIDVAQPENYTGREVQLCLIASPGSAAWYCVALVVAGH